MKLNITLKGNQYSFKGIETFDISTTDTGLWKLTVDGETVYTHPDPPENVEMSGFGRANLHDTPKEPSNLNTNYQTLPKNIYEVAAPDVANDLIRGAANGKARHGTDFTEELVRLCEKHLSEQQLKSLNLDNLDLQCA